MTVVVRGALLHCAFWVRHGRCRLNSREAEAREGDDGAAQVGSAERDAFREQSARGQASGRARKRRRVSLPDWVWIDPSNV